MNPTTVGAILEALPIDEQDHIMDILADELCGEDKVKLLRAVLNKFSKELEAKGVVADYFAYVLVYYVLPNLNDQQSAFPA